MNIKTIFVNPPLTGYSGYKAMWDDYDGPECLISDGKTESQAIDNLIEETIGTIFDDGRIEEYEEYQESKNEALEEDYYEGKQEDRILEERNK